MFFVLTDIKVSIKMCQSIPEFVCFEIRFNICYLNVCLIWIQQVCIHNIRIHDNNYVFSSKTFSIEILNIYIKTSLEIYIQNISCLPCLQSIKYFWKFSQRWFFINKLFTVQISKFRAIETNPKICPKHSFSLQLVNPSVCIMQLTKNTLNVI